MLMIRPQGDLRLTSCVHITEPDASSLMMLPSSLLCMIRVPTPGFSGLGSRFEVKKSGASKGIPGDLPHIHFGIVRYMLRIAAIN